MKNEDKLNTNQPCAVQSTSRQVIENKLLAALNDESKVAALLEERDLEDLIYAINWTLKSTIPINPPLTERVKRLRGMVEDLEQLRKAAFNG